MANTHLPASPDSMASAKRLYGAIRDFMELVEAHRRGEIAQGLGSRHLVDLDLDILKSIAQAPSLTFGELEAALNQSRKEPLNKSTLSQALKRLETGSLLSRNYNPNPRTPRITLTPDGKQLADKICDLEQSVPAAAASALAIRPDLAEKYADIVQKWIVNFASISRHAQASPAGIYDYLIGGQHNNVNDRKFAKDLLQMLPNAREQARHNRSFLRRAVTFMDQAGVDQFVDIGAGLPTTGNTHEVAQRVNEQCRVVYVDEASDVVQASNVMLSYTPTVAYICGRAQEPQGYWREIMSLKLDVPNEAQGHPLIDLARPIGVTLVAVLHFIPDDEEVRHAIRGIRDRLPLGSYLAISHATDEGLSPEEADQLVRKYKEATRRTVRLRSRQQLMSLMEGFSLTDDNLCFAPEWGRSIEDPFMHPPAANQERSLILVAVGRKDT